MEFFRVMYASTCVNWSAINNWHSSLKWQSIHTVHDLWMRKYSHAGQMRFYQGGLNKRELSEVNYVMSEKSSLSLSFFFLSLLRWLCRRWGSHKTTQDYSRLLFLFLVALKVLVVFNNFLLHFLPYIVQSDSSCKSFLVSCQSVTSPLLVG